jgi:hypothetical protein
MVKIFDEMEDGVLLSQFETIINYYFEPIKTFCCYSGKGKGLDLGNNQYGQRNYAIRNKN